MNVHCVEEVILKREEVKQDAVKVPAGECNEKARNSVKHVVVCGGDDRDEDGEGIGHSDDDEEGATEGLGGAEGGGVGHGGDGEADDEAVTEVEGGHRG